MHERIPILSFSNLMSSNVKIVEKALIDISRFSVGVHGPELTWNALEELAELAFAFAKSFLGPLALGQFEREDNALVAAFFEQRSADSYGHAAAIFAEVLLLDRMKSPG
jgi:hypothetical protein